MKNINLRSKKKQKNIVTAIQLMSTIRLELDVWDACGWKMDLVLSHTCPQKYVPIEAFMPGLDQKLVDHNTEEWLDQIENKLDYNAWYCGHWHIDKRIDKMHFLMHSVEAL